MSLFNWLFGNKKESKSFQNDISCDVSNTDLKKDDFNSELKVSDKTSVNGLNSSEFQIAFDFGTKMMLNQKLFFVFPNDTNPYLVSFVSWLPFLQELAKKENRSIVFATTNSSMEAKAQLNKINLFILQPLKFITWSDLVFIQRTEYNVLKKIIIIGDLDFGETNRTLSTCNGFVSEYETINFVNALNRQKNARVVLIHRSGWSTPFDLKSIQ